MSLPEYYQITPEINEINALIKLIEKACKNHAKLIQFRTKQLDQAAFFRYAKEVIDCAHDYQAQIILNGPLLTDEQLAQLKADGVHFTSKQLLSLSQKPDLPVSYLSASCHNLEQLIHAERLAFECVTLSPVLPTKTHPAAQPLGWTLFAQWARSVKLPVFALGGMGLSSLDIAKANGAYGVAGISQFFDLR